MHINKEAPSFVVNKYLLMFSLKNSLQNVFHFSSFHPGQIDTA